MAEDQRLARIFGVLYLITFITSIPALLLYEPALRHPVAFFRSRAFAPWTGIVALIGAVCFLVTFLTVLDRTTDGSNFGYAFFPAIVALAVWSVATSTSRYRSLGTADS